MPKRKAVVKKPRPRLVNVSTKAKRVGKRASNYSYRLTTLRKFVAGFDSKEFAKAYAAKPRTKAGKQKRAKLLAKVRSHFATLKPFVHRSHKAVKVKSERNREELRKHVGLTKIKGLRAVPVPTGKPRATSVRFDRKGRPTITVGKREEKVFRFPHMPRDADDAIAMLEEMLPDLPYGFYLLATRHHFLLHGVIERDQLVSELRAFFYQYRASPGFLKLLYGVKWLARSAETALQRRKDSRSERGRANAERKRISAEKAARQIVAMDRAFKAARSPNKLPPLSKRARATGRR
jgi:hypothetical protein